MQNSGPAVEEAYVHPDPAMASDELVCAGVGWSDADGDVEGYVVEWFVNDVSVAETQTLTTPQIGRAHV